MNKWGIVAIIFIIVFLIVMIGLIAAYYGGRGTTSTKPVWSATIGPGLDGAGNTVAYQRCDNWGGTNPAVCQNNPPTDVNGNSTIIGWEACAIGSSPGGLDPNNKFTACSPFSTTFSCLDAQNCYGFTSYSAAGTTTTTSTTNSTGPFTGVDSYGNTVTYQGCPNMTDLSKCVLPVARTAIKNWAVCDKGSSPGGGDPNNTGTTCYPYAPSSTNDCTPGKNCYAITNIVAKT